MTHPEKHLHMNGVGNHAKIVIPMTFIALVATLLPYGKQLMIFTMPLMM